MNYGQGEVHEEPHPGLHMHKFFAGFQVLSVFLPHMHFKDNITKPGS